MKQLDVVVSPATFVWNPYLTLAHVIFDLLRYEFFSSELQIDEKRGIRAHHALAQVGSKDVYPRAIKAAKLKRTSMGVPYTPLTLLAIKHVRQLVLGPMVRHYALKPKDCYSVGP